MFMLQYMCSPVLAGLMDGSVSTLGALPRPFATADNTWATFLVGNGRCGRRRNFHGVRRGAVRRAVRSPGAARPSSAGWSRGGMNGDRRARPHIALSSFRTSSPPRSFRSWWWRLELAVISWIRMRYMDTPFLQASFQVVVGGVLVFVAGY